MSEARHVVTVTVEGNEIGGWTEYEIASSMIEPADAFSMRRPFDASSWNVLRRDARVRVFIDGTPILDGFIDKRGKRSKEGTLEIVGRDRAGRVVQESAPRVNYQGLDLVEAVRQLASPWFTKVTLSDARNRRLRLGKSRYRVPPGEEPLVVKRSANGAGKVQPGTMRWAVIQELVSQAGLIAWASADGRELFVGRPNHTQAPSYHVWKTNQKVSGGNSTCRDLSWEEDNGDRYSLIAVVGTGGSTEVDFGMAVSTRRAYVTDNADNIVDGTGADFIYPKRLVLPEKNYNSNEDASRVAAREAARRDFRRTVAVADMPYHGQWVTPVGSTLFAPNTVALVTDEDFEPVRSEDMLVFACSYKRSLKDGETTMLEMVPVGTEVVQ